ncbi:MAG TPA: phage integrase N-terminal SAM-like domain-containing protein, partial [Nitrososphaeraceae archaeon]|nr:phage integrase N-terminal SAM-like domain-containing protein [Nitrososphaeraceae archaeon]
MRYNDIINNHNNNDQILLTITESERAYNNFVNAIKSPQTREKYSRLLFMYLNYLNLDKENLHLLLLQDPKKIQQDLINYVNWLKNERKLSYSTIKTRLYALFFFFDMNDVEIENKKKKISRNFPENIKTVKDRAYTIEEIKKIIDSSDLKMKIVVSLMVSTGCRIGAIPDLKYSALKYIEKYHLYEIFLYERTQDEYYSFTTPECAKYIDEYLDYRKRGG